MTITAGLPRKWAEYPAAVSAPGPILHTKLSKGSCTDHRNITSKLYVTPCMWGHEEKLGYTIAASGLRDIEGSGSMQQFAVRAVTNNHLQGAQGCF